MTKAKQVWSKALVFSHSHSGTLEASEDTIIKVGDRFVLRKAKQELLGVTDDDRIHYDNKYVSLVLKDTDGRVKPLPVVTHYNENEGKTSEITEPVDMNLRDWIINTALHVRAKYTEKTWLDKYGPVALLAITGVVCLLILWMTIKKI